MNRPLTMTHVLIFVLFLAAPMGLSAQNGEQGGTKNALVIESLVNKVTFQRDGTSRKEVEAKIRVLTEAGVQQMGVISFGYSSWNEKLTVDHVRVRKASGEVVPSSLDAIADVAPAALREAPMYSDFREKHVSVAGLRPGDTLEYRTTTDTIKPLAEGHFWFGHTFDKDDVVEEERLIIDVPKSVEINLKSPKSKPSVTETGDRRTYEWKTSNPVVKEKDKDEKTPNPLKEVVNGDVLLTTFKDWKELGEWFARTMAEHQEVTPEVRAKVTELTAGASDDTEKARRIYDFVAHSIRYISISVGIGRYQPHPASEVLTNRYGDCKDKHALFSVMLKAAGIESYPVLINQSQRIDPDVPSPAQVDHVITAIKSGDGISYSDTTAEVAPYRYLFYNLRDKKAVLVEAGNSRLVETPAIPSIESGEDFAVRGKFTEFGDFDGDMRITSSGDNEILMRLAFRRVPQAKWKDLVQIISYSLGYGGEVSEVKATDPDDAGKHFELTYHYHRKGYFDRSDAVATNTPPLPHITLADIEKIEDDGATPFELGGPFTLRMKADVEFPANYKVEIPAPVRLQRDYGEFASRYDLTGTKLSVERTIKLSLRDLPAEKRQDYISFRKAVTADEGQTISVRMGSVRAEDMAKESSAEELNDAGEKSFDARQYSVAAEFFQKAVEKDPKSKVAWNNLGRADLELGKTDEAIHALKKQIEINAFDAFAYNNLGRALERQNKFDEAIAAYRKQIEVNPLDKWAHSNLGRVLLDHKKYREAAEELETASRITPDDVNIKGRLGAAYLNLGESEKAKAIFEKAADFNRGRGVPLDIFAAVLSDSLTSDQSLMNGKGILGQLRQTMDTISVENESMKALAAMEGLATAWASLGWGHFHNGEYQEAEKYLEAAWVMSQSGVVGDRLGQTFEKLGDKERAAHAYALAMQGTLADQGTGDRLLELVGPLRTKSLKAKAGAELSESRTVRLNSTPISKFSNAIYNLVFTGGTSPTEVYFVSGDASIKRYESALKAAKFPVLYPDEESRQIKQVRQVTMSCGITGCAAVLMSPRLAASMPSGLLERPVN